MDDVVGVKVGQGECNIMTDVELGVIREGANGPIQESCQTLIHQLRPSLVRAFLTEGLSKCPETGRCLDA